MKRSALADLGARLLADEQVHERDVRLVAAGRAPAPPRRCARSGSAPPTAARRASAASPSARPRGRRRPARAACVSREPRRDPARVDVSHAQAAPPVARARFPARARRTPRCPPTCSASSAASRRPMPVRFGRPAHAVVGHLHAPARRRCARAAPRRASACACLCALRTASASTDCASGSSCLRDRRRARRRARSTRPRSGCSRRSRSTSSSSVVVRLRRRRARAGAAARGAGRAARPAARRRCARAPRRDELRLDRERQLHAEQPLDHALVDLAREVDALLQLPRALPAGRSRRGRPSASAAILPSVHSRWRSPSASGWRRRAVAQDHAAPAPGGGDRDADERRLLAQEPR